MTWSIIEADVPPDAARPGPRLEEAAQVSTQVATQIWGAEDLGDSARQIAATLRSQSHIRRALLLAVPAGGGPAVGTCWLEAPLADNTHTCEIYVEVAPCAQRAGAGTALVEAGLTWARTQGREVLHGWSEHGTEPVPEDPTALAAPSGAGLISADDAAAAFALHHGFTLEQVERHSVQEVPVGARAWAEVAELAQQARTRADPEYRLVSWAGGVPAEWIEAYCVLMARMSTDAPSAGLEVQEERWDPVRVHAQAATRRAAGLDAVDVAAVHVPTGQLAGHTQLLTVAHRPRIAYQEDTIVLAEHRGHRLGMWMKAANLRRLAETSPQVRSIHTWNAEENAHMLAINEALGYQPAGAEGVWQRRLS